MGTEDRFLVNNTMMAFYVHGINAQSVSLWVSSPLSIGGGIRKVDSVHDAQSTVVSYDTLDSY